MPKWRKIHIKTVDSVDLNDMPDDFTRLLWMMLPLILDRRGRGMDSAVWVRSNAMPLREDVTCEMIAIAMDWYAEHGMIERYQANKRQYFWIPTWHKYQRDTRREAESDFPAPPSYTDPFAEDTPPSPDDQGGSDSKPNSGAGQEQVESRSCSDADTDAEVDSDSEKKTPTGAKRKRAKPKKLSPIKQAAQEMFSALAELCQIDWHGCTQTQRKQLNQSEKLLRTKLDASPADLEEFSDWWYTHDWRGRGGKDKPPSPPRPHQVRETWGQFVTWRKNGKQMNYGSNTPIPAPPPDPVRVERDRAALRAHRARQREAAADAG